LKRFVDNAGLRHILQAINAPREIYALIGQNPAMKMEVEAGGHSAQMQVIDKEAKHAVASMEWLKATQEFVFTLYDKTSGVAKATFEIKPDGKAYLKGKEIATVPGTNDPKPILNDGSVKVKEHLEIGDRSGEAQLTLDSKAATASHVVFKRAGVPLSSIGAASASSDELIIEQRKDADIKFILPAGQTISAKIGGVWHDMMALARPTVISPYTATPTAAELLTALKKVVDYDIKGDMDFYVKDDPQTKLLLVKYRGVSTSTEAAPGNFFFEKLSKAV
jgi:hypothetical protein